MKEQQEQLQKIVNIRTKLMRKQWGKAICDFSMKRKVTITFYNSEVDFQETGYPSIKRAIEVQQEKMGRDFISFIGEDNMDELMYVL